MNGNWKHIKTIVDNQTFKIDSLNIWDHKWNDTGETIRIKDPRYGQTYNFNIFEIHLDQRNIRFAAGEFSNCVWGIYVEINK
jgi:hypothetical protein